MTVIRISVLAAFTAAAVFAASTHAEQAAPAHARVAATTIRPAGPVGCCVEED